MAATLVNKYIWLIKKLSTGERTLRELCHDWSNQSDLNSGNKELNRRTFFKWRAEINDRFGVRISWKKTSEGYVYYIERQPGEETIDNWLLKTISIENTISTSVGISDRIILEPVPSGESNLQSVLDAIKESRCISFTYADYWEDTIPVTIKPYFVKLFRQRWHVVGPLVSVQEQERGSRQLSAKAERKREYDSIRSYALDGDRFSNLKILDLKFKYPEDFSPQDFFRDNYSTLVDDRKKNPVTIVRVLVWEKQNFYFRSVPLHHSQQEIYTSEIDGYSIFEYYLQPTLDFIMDLRSFGNYVEVLQPQSLREIMIQGAKDVLDEYSGVSRRSCKEDVQFAPDGLE